MKHGEIYWAGLWGLILHRAPIPDSFLLHGQQYTESPDYNLPRLLELDLNRDGTATDQVIFHANRTLVSAHDLLDRETVADTMVLIYRRSKKLNNAFKFNHWQRKL